MNRVISFAAMATIALSGAASALTPDEALNRLYNTQSSPLRLNGGEHPELVMTGRSAAGAPTFYVFSTASRSFITAADDRGEALLGYLDTGNFNPAAMPPQMQSFLDSYSAEIAAAAASNRIYFKTGKINSPRRADRKAIDPLCKTGWNQDAPYNNLCPEKNGTRTYTGCVATAMAQAMKYFNYPEKGSGSVSYKWNGQTLSLDFSKTTFDWSNMLDTYDSSASTKQNEAVATLMKACGYGVEMNYGIASDGGSGAPAITIIPALVDYLNYDKGADLLYRELFTLDEWNQQVYDNISTVGPVVFCGSSPTGGHAFVIDGYSSDDFFHVNWGWGNTYDGYFKLSALNPEGQGIGGYEGGYNSNQTAIVGMRKPVAGSQKPTASLGILGTVKATAQGFTLTIGGTDGGGIWNTSAWPANFIFGILLTDSDNKTSVLASDDLGELTPGAGYTSFNIQVPDRAAKGTFTVSLGYKANGATDWSPIKGNGGKEWQAVIEIADDGVTVLEDGVGQPTVTSMTSGNFVVGQENTVEATIRNTGSEPLNTDVLAVICSIQGQQAYVEQRFASVRVELDGRASGDYKFTSTVSSELEPGNYYLVFVSPDYQQTYSRFYDITLYDPDDPELNKKDPAEISLGDVVVETGFTPGAECRVKAVVTGEGEETQQTALTPVIARRAAGGLTVLASLNPQNISLSKGETATVEFSGELPADLSGSDLRFAIYDESLSAVNGKTISVAIGPEAPFEVTSFTTAEGAVDPDAANIELTVKANRKFNSQISGFIGDALNPTATFAFPKASIAAGNSETLTYSGAIEGLTLGESYRARVFTVDNSFIIGIPGAPTLDFIARKADEPGNALTTITVSDENVSYYDLMGRRVSRPASGTIVIRVGNDGAHKIAIP